MRALWWMLTALAVLAIAYRYYSAFIAAKVLEPRRRPAHAGAREQRRTELPPHQPLGPLRPPLRRHHRRGAAHRPGARRAVRLPPRLHLDPLRRGPRRRGAGLRHPRRLGPPRRPVARGDRPRRARALPRPRHRGRHPLHRGHRAGGARERGRRGAGRVGVGRLHRRALDPDRARDGALHLPGVQGERGGDQRGHDRRRGAPPRGARPRARR